MILIEKKIPEDKNPGKIDSIVEKILNFNNLQKGKEPLRMLALCPSKLAHVACVAKVADRKFSNHKAFNLKQLKILISKQMLQKLPIALAQVMAGNVSENLLNEIRQIIYSL